MPKDRFEGWSSEVKLDVDAKKWREESKRSCKIQNALAKWLALTYYDSRTMTVANASKVRKKV